MRIFPTIILPVILLAATFPSVCPDTAAKAAEAKDFHRIDYRRFIRDNSGRPIVDLIRDAQRCRLKERIDSAAAFYSTAASLYSESLPERDIRRCAIAAVNLGYILLGWEMNASDAYPWLMKADYIAKKHGFNDIRTSVTSNLGRMYFDYNNFPKASEYLMKALSEVMAQKTDRYFGMSLIDFATAALFGQEHLLTGTLADRIIKYDVNPEATLAPYAKNLQKAIRKFKDGHPSDAAQIVIKSKRLIDTDSERKLYLVMHALIAGRLLMAAGEYSRATAILTDEIASAKAGGYYNLLEKCYSTLIECAKNSDDHEAAARYRYHALEIRDSLFSATRFESIKDIEKSTALEELKEGVMAANMRAERQMHTSIIVSCAAILLAGLLIWMSISRRKLSESYREIFKRYMELTERSIAAAAFKTQTAQTEKTACAEISANPTDPHDEKAIRLLQRISRFIEESGEVLNTDFSVEYLAESIQSKPKAVSQAINQIAGKNFNTFIGEYRVREACKMLTDPQNMKTMTIESIAESVGYKSRTYFSKVFKDITGLTPSQFAKQAMLDSKRSTKTNTDTPADI